jgi:hypothetical protein
LHIIDAEDALALCLTADDVYGVRSKHRLRNINEHAPCISSTSIREHLHSMQRTQDKQLLQWVASARQLGDRSTDKQNEHRMDPTDLVSESYPRQDNTAAQTSDYG